MLGPFAERLAAAAMHQQHRREWSAPHGRTSVVSEYAGWFSLKWFPLVIDILNQVAARAKGRHRHRVKGGQVPRASKSTGFRRRSASNHERQSKVQEQE